MTILPTFLALLLLGLQVEAFPHHFLVLRRGINPSIQYNLSPVRGLSRPYGYHPTKRIRPAVINPNGPMEPAMKETIGGADSLANEIMFDLQFLLDDDQPSTANAAGPDTLGIKAIARSLLDPDDPKRLLRIS